jgi:hypothetical protein
MIILVDRFFAQRVRFFASRLFFADGPFCLRTYRVRVAISPHE